MKLPQDLISLMKKTPRLPLASSVDLRLRTLKLPYSKYYSLGANVVRSTYGLARRRAALAGRFHATLSAARGGLAPRRARVLATMTPAAGRRLRLIGGHVSHHQPATAAGRTLDSSAAAPALQQHTQLGVRPLGAGPVGAEVRGVDAADPLSPDVCDALRDAVDRWGVVCLRGQRRLRHERQAEFATEVFGTAVEPHALWGDEDWMRHTGNKHVEGLPPTTMLFTGEQSNALWHTDVSCATRPPAVTLLHNPDGVLPARGLGQTLFTDMRAVLNALPPPTIKALRALRGVHYPPHIWHPCGPLTASPEVLPPQRLPLPDVDGEVAVHPAIRRHPRTGAESVYINPLFTRHFEGQTAEESALLLEEIYSVARGGSAASDPAAVVRQFGYSHVWEPYDLLIWDNRSVWHYAVYDYGGESSRHVLRCTAAGEEPD